MSLTLSIASLRKHWHCEIDDRIAELRQIMPNITEDQQVPIRVWWDLPSTSVADRWWSLRAAKPQMVARQLGAEAACLAARRVSPLTRKNDLVATLACIQEAETWVKSQKSSQNKASQDKTPSSVFTFGYIATALSVFYIIYIFITPMENWLGFTFLFILAILFFATITLTHNITGAYATNFNPYAFYAATNAAHAADCAEAAVSHACFSTIEDLRDLYQIDYFLAVYQEDIDNFLNGPSYLAVSTAGFTLGACSAPADCVDSRKPLTRKHYHALRKLTLSTPAAILAAKAEREAQRADLDRLLEAL